MTVTLDIKGQKQLLEAVRKSPETTTRNIRLALKRSVRDVQRYARRNHKFESKTHALERSVAYQVHDDMSAEVFLDNNVSTYAGYIHEGTDPYQIVPKNKKALRWVSGNGFAFAKKVNHPGITKDPFLYEAAEKTNVSFQENINNAIQKSLEEADLS